MFIHFKIRFITKDCLGLQMYKVNDIYSSGPSGVFQGHPEQAWHIEGDVTHQPLGQFTPNQVYMDCFVRI